MLSALIFICTTTTAEAKIAKRCSVNQKPRHELNCGYRNLHHANSLQKFLRTNPQAGTLRTREQLWKDSSWLKKYATKHISTAKQRMYVSSRPAHYNGWICIHNLEGSWYDKGAPYYGGLQMSYGWAGRVTDASLLSPMQQMWAAENEAAEHNFNYTWMQGQWPNTFPPCSGYF